MSVAEIKQELHKAIDGIENKELLQAMLIILSQSGTQSQTGQLTDEQMWILKEREEEYLKGDTKVQSLEEYKQKMNKKYGL
jgi:hypothetical protein